MRTTTATTTARWLGREGTPGRARPGARALASCREEGLGSDRTPGEESGAVVSVGRREALVRKAAVLGASSLLVLGRAERGASTALAVEKEGATVEGEATTATVGAPSSPPAEEDFITKTPEPEDWYGFEDIYDNYFVSLPPEWNVVTTSGADMFYKNTENVEQNLFVELSSKSFSKYKSLPDDFGSPSQCAETFLSKYMDEFVSTRLGITRQGRVVAAAERTKAEDGGRLFYDFLINIDSYAARNQYGITSGERKQSKEWDRYFLTTVGIQGERLLVLRIQCSKEDYPKDRERLLHILHSFQLKANNDFESAPGFVPDNLRGKKKPSKKLQ
ncbi:PsbP domain-containing protein [Chloropicon primus]|nr:PsbP domain-containing protein [Chloropicon primus]|mmetsp:Transcript_21330/g.44876  ORF Transcript_21330/g.44876 Transcript_21330/m.44876 type:complete len:332 (-) Transcript_21330:639-1634(-)